MLCCCAAATLSIPATWPAAIKNLEKVADLDSHPDGLRALMQAYLQSGRLPEAGTLAAKLCTVHNDTGAITSYADALMAAGQLRRGSAGLPAVLRSPGGHGLRQGSGKPAFADRAYARECARAGNPARSFAEGRRHHSHYRTLRIAGACLACSPEIWRKLATTI